MIHITGLQQYTTHPLLMDVNFNLLNVKENHLISWFSIS